MSLRVLITCWPFEGHVMPNLAIAAALRDRGAEVSVLTASSAHPVVTGAGFEAHPFVSLGPAWERVAERERSVGHHRQSLRVARQAFLDWIVATIPDQVRDVREAVRRDPVDVVVTDMTMYGPAVVVREALDLPVAVSSPLMGCMLPGRDVPFPALGRGPAPRAAGRAGARAARRVADVAARGVRARVDGFRADAGLPPLAGSINDLMAGLPLYLQMSLPELDHGRRDLPASVRYVGACVWHPPEPAGTTAWLDELPRERPWVHVTEGTSHHQQPFLLRAAAAGLAGTGVEAVLTTGGGRTTGDARAAAGLGLERAPNVHVRDWLSHQELLPRCDVVVTTGGAGTVMAALGAGVPLVVVPTTWDKPGNARRVVAAGAGVHLPPRRCTPEGLRAAVEDVLADPAYRDNARRIAARLAAAPGPDGAAALIAGLVGAETRDPVLGGAA